MSILRAIAALAAVSMLAALGCGRSSELPPGGAPAVQYWQRVLLQYPDLPAKVEAIVERQGRLGWLGGGLPQCEVTIHGEDGTVSVQGRHVDVIVTDLDEAALRKLLAWWKAVPKLAEELKLVTTLPFELPASTRHVIVLGKQGRIEITGPRDQYSQSIHVFSNEVAGRMTIGVDAFGPEGEAAVEHLANQYKRVRGPPRAEVNAGRISRPPPEEAVTVVVIGELESLDIGGPSEDAHQEITFANYLNRHQQAGTVLGVAAGSPFPEESFEVAERQGQYEDAGRSESITDTSPATNSTPGYQQAVAVPVTPINLPGTIQLPAPIQVPKNDFNFNPGLHMPPVVIPPVTVPRPVTVPHFR